MDQDVPPRTPKWVWVLGGLVGIGLVLVLALHFMGRMVLHH